MQQLSESTYLVLLALRQEVSHGYGIIKRIEEVSEGTFLLAPGTLYGVLNNLQKQKLIETVDRERGSRNKTTYRITGEGEQVLSEEFERIKRLIRFTEKTWTDKERQDEG
ncbi:PadR family transcriptional regulator [Saccharibacillus kuerlensis]|uniref:PadR family transcriptional regulator n=1 Tax=Saccharibacillus kuerlensis TaxID=459527 RepID=A0ABQ2L142_9BACL|nr:PadR family transcriptional regulator [Saccharibacillus kuerlensis]GGN97658.1 PadR family transcriptional regulator [Saccharibacillus kuerlensis]